MASIEPQTEAPPYAGKLSKSIMARALNSSAGDRFMACVERLDVRRPNLLQVLTYHRIENRAGFEQQMKYLAANYHVTSMLELLAVSRGDGTLPPRSVMITFDDAYKNFAEVVWPVLRRYGLPVTLFVPTAFPDQCDRLFWWDRLQHALCHTPRRDMLDTPVGRCSLATATERKRVNRRLQTYVRSLPHSEVVAWVDHICVALGAPAPDHDVLDWNALRALASEGVVLGAHTRTHPLLDRVSFEEAQNEAVGSLRDLEREIGEVLPVLAYPSGRFTDELVEALRRAGFALAFTMVRGTDDLRVADPLRLRRINIGEHATPAVLRARLLQSTLYMNRWRPLLSPWGQVAAPVTE